MQTIKCVVVGDGSVGKTCMLFSYFNNYAPNEYIPTVFDNFSTNIEIDRRIVRLEVWDTAGQEGYDRLRPLSYPNTDIFLVCFSVVSRESFHNIKLKWIPEIKHFSGKSKIILIGTKCDIRDHFGTLQMTESIIYSEGLKLANNIGAVKYLECSAFTQVGLSAIFKSAVESVLYAPTPVKTTKMRCSIL